MRPFAFQGRRRSGCPGAARGWGSDPCLGGGSETNDHSSDNDFDDHTNNNNDDYANNINCHYDKENDEKKYQYKDEGKVHVSILCVRVTM